MFWTQGQFHMELPSCTTDCHLHALDNKRTVRPRDDSKQCNKSYTKILSPAFSDPSNCHSLQLFCGGFRSLLSMGSLPDELWTKILGVGVEKGVLDYRDLCSLAFVCHRVRRISSLECIWRPLWQRDQAELGGSSVSEPRKEKEIKSFRDLYRIRFEKVRAAKMAAHKRRVLRVQSAIAVLQHDSQITQSAIEKERDKLSAAVAELKRFELACRSSIALQIWQPQAVRSRHHEVLQQETVNVGARQKSLQMEINVCRFRIQQFEKSLQAMRRTNEERKRELEALTFNPSRQLQADERADRKAAQKRKRDISSSSSHTPQSV